MVAERQFLLKHFIVFSKIFQYSVAEDKAYNREFEALNAIPVVWKSKKKEGNQTRSPLKFLYVGNKEKEMLSFYREHRYYTTFQVPFFFPPTRSTKPRSCKDLTATFTVRKDLPILSATSCKVIFGLLRKISIASYGDTRVELTHNQTKEIKVILLDKIAMATIEDKVKQLLLCNRRAYQAFKEAQEIINAEFYGATISGDLTTTTKDLLIENNLWSPSCYNPAYIQTINRIKNGFRYEKLSDLVLPIKKGVEVGSENYLIEMEKSTDDVPFIRTSDIYNHEIDYAPDYYVSTQIACKNKCPDLRSGDIIFSKDGKVGEVGIINLDNSLVPSSGFAVLRSKGKISGNYLFAVLSHKEIIKNQAKMKTVIAATIPHLKIEKINDFYVPIFGDDKIKMIDNAISVFRKNIIEKQNYIQEIERVLNTYYDKLFS